MLSSVAVAFGRATAWTGAAAVTRPH
jgi:hypothetical protein